MLCISLLRARGARASLLALGCCAPGMAHLLLLLEDENSTHSTFVNGISIAKGRVNRMLVFPNMQFTVGKKEDKRAGNASGQSGGALSGMKVIRK